MDITRIIGVLLISMLWGTIFTMPVFFIALIRRAMPRYKKKKYDEAIKDGVKLCQAEAEFVKVKHRTNNDDVTVFYYVYEFKFEGKKYKYETTRDDLQRPVIVKFLDENPKGAVLANGNCFPAPKDPMVGTIAVFIIATVLNLISILG